MAGMFQITGSVAATSGENKPADEDTKAKKDSKSNNVEEKSICKKTTSNVPMTGSLPSYNLKYSEVKDRNDHSTTQNKKTSSISFNFATVRKKTGKTKYEEHKADENEQMKRARKMGRFENN